eukprot:10419210-Alexandrium_andersonii.AAC.1
MCIRDRAPTHTGWGSSQGTGSTWPGDTATPAVPNASGRPGVGGGQCQAAIQHLYRRSTVVESETRSQSRIDQAVHR